MYSWPFKNQGWKLSVFCLRFLHMTSANCLFVRCLSLILWNSSHPLQRREEGNFIGKTLSFVRQYSFVCPTTLPKNASKRNPGWLLNKAWWRLVISPGVAFFRKLENTLWTMQTFRLRSSSYLGVMLSLTSVGIRGACTRGTPTLTCFS